MKNFRKNFIRTVFACLAIAGLFLMSEVLMTETLMAETPVAAAEDPASVQSFLSEWTQSRTNSILGGRRLPSGTLYLRDFCQDAELNAWLDGLEENMPVKMELWTYGEAPYEITFTEPEVISETIRALETVVIGDVSPIDPDSVCDAGGVGYYFEMQDGSTVGFPFIMGTFRWKGGEYHRVADFGTLQELTRILNEIGNPRYEYIYSPDDGFHTKYLEIYKTGWLDESKVFGGLFLYIGDEGEVPFVSIGRCRKEMTDPEEYIRSAIFELKEAGRTVEGLDPADIKMFDAGGKELPSVQFFMADEDGRMMEVLILAMQTRDSLLREDHVVRFCAAYRTGDEREKNQVMRALDAAVENFYLKQMYFEKRSVQPDNFLLDFCNSDALNAWYENALTNLPDQLVYMADTWYLITDRDTIRQVLEALKTVKIGGLSKSHVGASGRQTFDFIDADSGNSLEFMFFQNTFSWEANSYDILDWGDLVKIDLKAAASRSPGK